MFWLAHTAISTQPCDKRSNMALSIWPKKNKWPSTHQRKEEPKTLDSPRPERLYDEIIDNAYHFVQYHRYCSLWRPANQAYYTKILTRVCEAVHRKRPELWLNSWFLYYDNNAAH
jgi:hypothetical protein